MQIEKSTGELSPVPYFSLMISSSVALMYGFLIRDLTTLIVNTLGFGCSIYYLLNFYRFTKEKTFVQRLIGLGVAFVVCVFVYVMFLAPAGQARLRLGLVGICVGTALFASPLATIRKVLATKSTESMDFFLSACATACSLSWFLYGCFVLSDLFVWLPNAIGVVLCMLQLLLFAKFPSKQSTSQKLTKVAGGTQVMEDGSEGNKKMAVIL